MLDGVRVLIAEDEIRLADAIARGLRRQGFAVDLAPDGEQALSKTRVVRYDVLVLDRDLPGVHGDDVCRVVRAERPDTGILMLTAAGALEDVIDGLSLGADDYLPKPFSPRELTARIRAVLRRSARVDEPALLTLGPVTLSPSAREARVDGREITLTQREFDLLEYLMVRSGRVVTRDELLEAVWGFVAPGQTRTVEVHLAQLRKKLGHPELILTVRGVGYKATA